MIAAFVAVAFFSMASGLFVGWRIGRHDAVKDLSDDLDVFEASMMKLRTHCNVCGLPLQAQCPKLCELEHVE